MYPRFLTHHEKELVYWFLEQRKDLSETFNIQVNDLLVKSACSCGCASIDFKYKNIDQLTDSKSNIEIIADYKWKDENGNLFGIFLFSKENILAGLEVWSIDGNLTPRKLPAISKLIPINQDF
ncbi:hypothetical protein AB3N60_10935 [Leptospira sp. WS39.C2]